MEITGKTPDQIIKKLAKELPEIPEMLERVGRRIPWRKRQIADYQAAALYTLVRPYNSPECTILELGTAQGFSAAVMAEAAPDARIITLNPDNNEATSARYNLRYYPNVTVVEALSWDYLKMWRGPGFDVIFVDGDHKRVRQDLPWWDHLLPGGAFLFHDYSPEGTYRECPPVFEALNEWAEAMQHPFDVLVVDDGGVGFAGFYKPIADEVANTDLTDQSFENAGG